MPDVRKSRLAEVRLAGSALQERNHRVRFDCMSSLAWHRLSRWLPPFIWMCIMFFASSRSALPGPTGPDSLADILYWKTAHVAEYAILASLLWRATGGGGGPRIRSFASSFAVSLLFAVLDECHQTSVTGREGKAVDVAIDSLGVLLALGALWRLRRSTGQTKES